MTREPADRPSFDSSLLREVAAAFISRRKAIRYQAGWALGREFSETADGTTERLNLDLQPAGRELRLSVWSDGELWLRLCAANPGRNTGWAFLDQFHGSVRDVSAATLVAMVETMIAEPFRPGGSDPVAYRERLRTICGRLRPRAA